MKNFSKNKGKESFIKQFEGLASIDSGQDTLASRCKFNFSYLDVQPNSQAIEDWTKEQLVCLFNKLKAFSKEPLAYWIHQNLLHVHGSFPQKSALTKPKFVPHQAKWATFRIEKATRLVGFILPDEYNWKPQEKTKHLFDCNVFYIVFLDEKHQFYPMDITGNSN